MSNDRPACRRLTVAGADGRIASANAAFEKLLPEEVRTRAESLTPRELEIFHRVADGQANKVVAIDLGISERTVEIQRSQVMQKTGSRSLADLVRMRLTLERATARG